jgi:hypothetical protein
MIAVNDLDLPTWQREHKAFATLAALYAMRGYGLIKADPAIGGQPTYFAMRWGAIVRPLADLDVAGGYLCTLMQADRAGNGQKLQGQ